MTPPVLAARVRLFGLYAFAIALPFNLWSMQAALGLVGLALAVESLLASRRPVWPRALVAPIALYVAAVGLSWLGGGGPPESVDAALAFWPVFAPLVLAAAIPDARTAVRLWLCVIAVASFMGVYGVVQHWTGADLFRLHTHIARAAPSAPDRFLAIGNFETHTTYAFSLAFPALVAAAFALEGVARRVGRAALAMGGFVISAGILLSYVRSIWLGLLAGLLLMVLLRRGAALKLALALCVVGGVAVLAVPSLRERASSAVDVRYNVGRAYIWERSWRMLADHPGSGIGFGRYRTLQRGYFDPTAPPEEVPHTGAHSTYLHIAVELGLLGLAAFLWLWLRVFGAAFSAFRNAPVEDRGRRAVLYGGAGAVACFLVGSLFQESFYDGEVAFGLWFAVATVFAAARTTLGAEREVT